jgi:hypothetical protein
MHVKAEILHCTLKQRCSTTCSSPMPSAGQVVRTTNYNLVRQQYSGRGQARVKLDCSDFVKPKKLEGGLGSSVCQCEQLGRN